MLPPGCDRQSLPREIARIQQGQRQRVAQGQRRRGVPEGRRQPQRAGFALDRRVQMPIRLARQGGFLAGR